MRTVITFEATLNCGPDDPRIVHLGKALAVLMEGLPRFVNEEVTMITRVDSTDEDFITALRDHGIETTIIEGGDDETSFGDEKKY